MPVPLIGARATKSDDDSRQAREYREAVQRAKNVEGPREAVGAITLPFGAQPHSEVRSGSGIGQFLAGAYPDAPPAPETVQKAARGHIHTEVRHLAATLPDNQLRLSDLVVKANEQHRGAALVDCAIGTVSRALDIAHEEAEMARKGLEARGPLTFHDNGSGDRGFRPRLPQRTVGRAL